MGKHSSDKEPVEGVRGKGGGSHQKTPDRSVDDPERPGSFWVESGSREERGVGNRQEGGRDDY